ncbi:M23 family metallopeptidase [Anaerobacillus sp. MEB173]|uniref:M23 family metallopeptidase n=1 Tax=Anaerobacillus sp. MEB173 TaxID=3383345 RepID=UPI003F90DDFE
MKFILTGKFEEVAEIRGGRAHTGIDLAMPEGTELRSVGNAIVEKVFDYGSQNAGKGVVLKLQDGSRAVYGHMSEITVEKGQKLNFMDTIGYSGNTGNSSGAHLHFSLQSPDGKYIDPTPYADGINAITGNIEAEKSNFFLEKFNAFSDWVVGKEVEFVFKPLGDFLKQVSIDTWNWIIVNLPDIMGYTTMAAGAFVILFSMIGKGGMMKPLGIYAGLLILALAILTGVKA